MIFDPYWYDSNQSALGCVLTLQMLGLGEKVDRKAECGEETDKDTHIYSISMCTYA